MFRLTALVAVVLIVAFLWWATRKLGEKKD